MRAFERGSWCVARVDAGFPEASQPQVAKVVQALPYERLGDGGVPEVCHECDMRRVGRGYVAARRDDWWGSLAKGFGDEGQAVFSAGQGTSDDVEVEGELGREVGVDPAPGELRLRRDVVERGS